MLQISPTSIVCIALIIIYYFGRKVYEYSRKVTSYKQQLKAAEEALEDYAPEWKLSPAILILEESEEFGRNGNEEINAYITFARLRADKYFQTLMTRYAKCYFSHIAYSFKFPSQQLLYSISKWSTDEKVRNTVWDMILSMNNKSLAIYHLLNTVRF